MAGGRIGQLDHTNTCIDSGANEHITNTPGHGTTTLRRPEPIGGISDNPIYARGHTNHGHGDLAISNALLAPESTMNLIAVRPLCVDKQGRGRVVSFRAHDVCIEYDDGRLDKAVANGNARCIGYSDESTNGLYAPHLAEFGIHDHNGHAAMATQVETGQPTPRGRQRLKHWWQSHGRPNRTRCHKAIDLGHPDVHFTHADVDRMPSALFAKEARGLVSKSTSKGRQRAWEYHISHGHPGRARMHDILTHKHERGLQFNHADIDAMPGQCPGCEFGKPRRHPFKGTHDPEFRGDRDVVVYMDAFGPTRTAARGGHHGRSKNIHYAMIFVTRRSRTSFAYPMAAIGQTKQIVETFLLDYLAEYGHYPTALFADQASVNKSKDVKAYCNSKGVKLTGGAPHASSSNMAERYIKTIMDIARCMLHHTDIGSKYPELWWYAVDTANHIRNRMPCKGNPGGKSPYHMEHGEPPDNSYFREWGSTAYDFLPHDAKRTARSESLARAARKGILVGYDTASNSKSYLIFFPDSKDKCGRPTPKVLTCRDVRFFSPDSAPRSDVTDADFRKARRDLLEFRRVPHADVPIQAAERSPVSAPEAKKHKPHQPQRTKSRADADDNWRSSPVGVRAPSRKQPPPAHDAPGDSLQSLLRRTSRRHHRDKRDEKADRVAKARDRQRQQHDPRSWAAPAIKQVERRQEQQRERERRLARAKQGALCPPELRGVKVSELEVPKTEADVKNSPQRIQWEYAKYVEFDGQMIGKGVLERIAKADLPEGKRAFPCKMVYAIKCNPDGTVRKFKARFVAQGFRQRPGHDYDINGTYAPVGMWTSIKGLISVAVQSDMHIFQFDVEGAFLLPDIKEECYIVFNGNYYKLHKTLYGLKQSAYEWNSELHKEFIRLGLRQSKGDPCVYVREDHRGKLLICTWVDDIVGAASSKSLYDEFMQDFKYPFSSSGSVDYILKINIERQRDGSVKMHQKPYIEDMAREFRVQHAKPKYTPMPTDVKYSKEQCPAPDSDEYRKMKKTPYRRLLGCLLYATNVRSDITYAVHLMARFAENPAEVHWRALKRILIYLYTTRDRGLVFRKTDGVDINNPISVRVDADHGACVDTRRSTTGIHICVFGNSIRTKSKRQGKVANSTGHAEFVALAMAVRDITHIRIVLDDMGFHQKCIPFESDSQVAVQQLHAGRLTSASKHIALDFYAVKEHMDAGLIDVTHLPGDDNTADLMTKPLVRTTHERHTAEILNDI